ncbi:hypothetical protein JMJ56_32045 [Belnapia sp. T18]|uniref:Uncharacterized protein n=1 Tax=Belnapia arida TaxID=2804533 RepID=A0ABS1UF45_9PROT|nr:hypothetical protein [Belnapia arida]MBL6082599.1 hypothetical protein [Belnapia arida]
MAIAHGLSIAPQQVQLVPISPVQSGAGHYVTGITSTAFTVNLGTPATSDRTFAWRATF